jgi:uncharacterized RDD family membrane protein YckC
MPEPCAESQPAEVLVAAEERVAAPAPAAEATATVVAAVESLAAREPQEAEAANALMAILSESEAPESPAEQQIESVAAADVEEAAAGVAHTEPQAEPEPAAVIGFVPAQPSTPKSAMPLRVTTLPAAPLSVTAAPARSAAAAAARVAKMPAPAAAAEEPEWRKEVSQRLKEYRARRRRNGRSAATEELVQTALPFEPGAERDNPEYRVALRRHSVARAVAALPEAAEPAPEDTVEIETTPAGAEAPAAEPRAVMELEPEAAEPQIILPEARHEEGEAIEISVAPPRFELVGEGEEDAHPQAPLVPVADIRERLRAGLLDGVLVLFSFAVFLFLFRWLGGELSFGKPEAVIYALALFLVYAQYFGLFTVFGGTTPGMYFRGLSVVGFDGCQPMPKQLLWRSFGNLLSGGTMMLGFLWCLWDEDFLTWHDRVSQTYVTRAEAAMWRDLEAGEGNVIARSARGGTPEAT